MNPRWLQILQHTLGLDQYGQPPEGHRPCSDDDFPNCYRNNYCIGPESPNFATLCDLVTCGLMTDAGAKEVLGGMHVFHATRKGYAAVKEHSPTPPVISKKRGCYRAFLRADYGHPFHRYIGVDDLPFYEREPQGSKVRMVRKFYFPTTREVAGEWCSTRKEAKTSYKQALAARRSKTTV